MDTLSYQNKLEYLRVMANDNSIANKLINAIRTRGKKELCQAAEQVILALEVQRPLVNKVAEHLGLLSGKLSETEDLSNLLTQVRLIQDAVEGLAQSLGLGGEIKSKDLVEQTKDGKAIEVQEVTTIRRYLWPGLKPQQILTKRKREAVLFNLKQFLPCKLQEDIQNRLPSSFYKWRSRYIELQRNQRPFGTTEQNLQIIRDGTENYYWILKSTPRELAAELFEAGLVRIMEIEAGKRLKDFPLVIHKSLEKERYSNPRQDLMLLVHSTPPEWSKDTLWPSYHLIQVANQIILPDLPGYKEYSLDFITEEFISNKKAFDLANIYLQLQNSAWCAVAGTSRILVQKKLKRKERKSEQEIRDKFERGILDATHDMSDLAREMLKSEMEAYKPKKETECACQPGDQDNKMLDNAMEV